MVERLEWGDFHGHVRAVKQGDQTLESLEASFPVLQRLVAEKAKTRAEISALQKGELGELNRSIEQLRLAERRLALGARPEPERSRRAAAIAAESARLQTEYDALAARLGELRRSFESDSIVVETADGETRELLVGSVVRAIRPNALGLGGAIALYASRVREFVADDPRESNTEGGIFPAIFGTVLMVILMSLVVTPFGVVAAVYLHEYAKDGPLVRAVRIAVNNLAGVPSIVFGVFGLGFFVYGIGGTIDQLFFASAPTPTFGTGGILWAGLTRRCSRFGRHRLDRGGPRRGSTQRARGSLALGATRSNAVAGGAAGRGARHADRRHPRARSGGGEVAPLMIVGMVKLAPSLPIDGSFPSCTSNGSSCISAFTSTTSASESERRSSHAAGLRPLCF